MNHYMVRVMLGPFEQHQFNRAMNRAVKKHVIPSIIKEVYGS